MAKITVQNLSKEYKGGMIHALRDVSFECPDGDFFCLLGPAGAGKTTTVKLIAGTEIVDQGAILFDDVNITDVMPKDRDIAVAFETYALYPQRTVRENLAFPLQAPGRKNEWDADNIEKRVKEIANLLGIGELLDRFPRQLSGGQRQRVALGRALVRRPKAYLLDEPIAHLDAKLRHRMRGELKRIQMDLGITTLYTTPDQLEALSLADHMAVLNQGMIEQIGTPDEVYKRPKNVFVARFVGDPPMNIYPAQLDGDEVDFGGWMRLQLSAELRNVLNEHHESKEVLVGMRPKDILLVSENSDQANARGSTTHVQVLGETSVVTMEVNSSEMRIKVPTKNAPDRSQNIGLVVNIRECHFFDPKTELRIEGL